MILSRFSFPSPPFALCTVFGERGLPCPVTLLGSSLSPCPDSSPPSPFFLPWEALSGGGACCCREGVEEGAGEGEWDPGWGGGESSRLSKCAGLQIVFSGGEEIFLGGVRFWSWIWGGGGDRSVVVLHRMRCEVRGPKGDLRRGPNIQIDTTKRPRRCPGLGLGRTNRRPA